MFTAEIEHFFKVYKTLEEKDTDIYGWAGAEEAWQAVTHAQRRFRSR